MHKKHQGPHEGLWLLSPFRPLDPRILQDDRKASRGRTGTYVNKKRTSSQAPRHNRESEHRGVKLRVSHYLPAKPRCEGGGPLGLACRVNGPPNDWQIRRVKKGTLRLPLRDACERSHARGIHNLSLADDMRGRSVKAQSLDRPGQAPPDLPGRLRTLPAPHSIQHTITAGAIPRAGRNPSALAKG